MQAIAICESAPLWWALKSFIQTIHCSISAEFSSAFVAKVKNKNPAATVGTVPSKVEHLMFLILDFLRIFL